MVSCRQMWRCIQAAGVRVLIESSKKKAFIFSLSLAAGEIPQYMQDGRYLLSVR